MECPNKHGELEKALFHHVEVDYCHECLGVWFDQQEFTEAKNDADETVKWMDFDIWRDEGKFKVSPSDRRCPKCRLQFVEVAYDGKSATIDFCKHCRGVWLDRGEFKQIMVYLRKKSDYDVLHHYTKNLILELWEVFAGPEKFREELSDFLMLIKLFKYKFVAQHPVIEKLIEDLPK